MKLKSAISIAKKMGYKYIAVNIYKKIYGYKRSPFLLMIGGKDNSVYIGKYTGKKHWLKTVREVKND